MELKLNGYTLIQYNEVDINLKFDAISDTFSFSFDWEPSNALHRKLFKPLSYYDCAISHGGVLILTGTVLSHKFASAGDPPKQQVYISGYATTGVLEDSCILNVMNTNPQWTASGHEMPNGNNGIQVINPGSNYLKIPLNTINFNNYSLPDFAQAVTSWYGIGVVIDPELANDADFNKRFDNIDIEPDTKVGKKLNDLCEAKNVVLTHTPKGELLITRAKVNDFLTNKSTFIIKYDDAADENTPVKYEETKTQLTKRNILWHFVRGDGSYTDASLSVDGQAMHAIIQVVGDGGKQEVENAADSAIFNPLIADGTTRYLRSIQKAGDQIDTPDTARQLLSEELKNISIIIQVPSWTLGGHLITPNQLVTIKDHDIYMFTATKLFIQEVRLFGNELSQVATLTCVIPECFNDETPKNIFK